jgi:succinate-semialdehyde dehydrogenase/glutarate-semialdehyde dehydrogenase
MSIQTINPSTNKTEKSFEEMTEKTVDTAVAQAARAFDHWKKTSYAERAALLHIVMLST